MGCLHVLFIRHGETQDNIDRMLQGLRDTDLTPKGHEQAQHLATLLQDQHIDVIYHSPLKRIKQTIQPIIPQHPGVTVHSDPNLVGQSLGSLEGGSYDQIDMNNPRSADGMPGVELFADFVKRHKHAFGRMIGREAPLVKDDKDRTVVVATHGVGITSLFKTLEATPLCDKFNPPFAVRGPQAFEVRWTDADDIAKLVVNNPGDLPITADHELDWDAIHGKPFLIEIWGKQEKAL